MFRVLPCALLAAAMAGSASALAPSAAAEIHDIVELLQHKAAGPMKVLVLKYTYVEGALWKRGPYMTDHLKGCQKCEEEGTMLMGGAFNEPCDGALLFFDAEKISNEEVQKFADTDPFVTHGLVPTRSIHELTATTGTGSLAAAMIVPGAPILEVDQGKMFALRYGYAEGSAETRDAHRADHMVWVKKLDEAGSLLLYCAFEDPYGAVLLFDPEKISKGEIENAAEADPFVSEGLVADRSVCDYTASVGTLL